MTVSKSYHWICESCSEEVPVGRYCPDCGSEQSRAVEAIERMRSQRSEDDPDDYDQRIDEIGRRLAQRYLLALVLVAVAVVAVGLVLSSLI